MSLFERLRRLRPTPIKTEEQVPQFYDTEAGVAFMTSETAAQFLGGFLGEHGREAKYPLEVQIWQPGNKGGIEPGMYCKTNFTASEWDQSLMIKSAHSTLIMEVLGREGYLPKGQVIILNVSNYGTPEGYAILKIDTMAKD